MPEIFSQDIPFGRAAFLQATATIDFQTPEIVALADRLAGSGIERDYVLRCFNWVRDEIRHSVDHGDQIVTVRASDVLRHRTGLCYAKTHLLAALLRARNIPCGFTYQRLALDDACTVFCLHGLNAVWLDPYGWCLADPRGNRPGISTDLDPPHSRLAFPSHQPGEGVFPEIYAAPWPVVLAALERHDCVTELCEDLPDCEIPSGR